MWLSGLQPSLCVFVRTLHEGQVQVCQIPYISIVYKIYIFSHESDYFLHSHQCWEIIDDTRTHISIIVNIHRSAVVTWSNITWYCDRGKIYISLYSQKTPHISPSRASYGLCIVFFFREKTSPYNRTVPHIKHDKGFDIFLLWTIFITADRAKVWEVITESCVWC